MNKLKLITSFCLITLISLCCLQNINADQLKFTKKEQAWINQGHTIRARIGGAPPLHFYDGSFQGISVDYLNLIAKRAGLKIQYLTGVPWSRALENIKNHQELDLILTAKNTPERQKVMIFTRDYLLMPYAIFCRKDTDFIKTIDNLDNIKVSVEQDYVIHKKLLAEYPKIKLIIKKTSEEAIKAIALGEADAYIGNLTTTSYIIQKNNLTNLKVTAPTPFENHNQAMAIRNDWPELNSIIDKTLGTLKQEEHNIIQKKWSSPNIDQDKKNSLEAGITTESPTRSIHLTITEKNWLVNHPKIRVHNELNWPPFNFNVNGTPKGLSIDYMNLLANRIGIDVEYISGEWGELLEMTFEKKLDVMLNIVNTPERQEHLIYTGSYLKNPNVIISKENSGISDIQSLFGKRVSFPSGFFYEALLKNQYPQIERVPVKDSLASLKAVEFDKSDAALGELAVVNYLIRENHLSDLVAKQEFSTGNPELEKLNIAVRNDWPELQSILIKAMTSVSEEEIQKLKNKWMNQTDYKTYENQDAKSGIPVWRLSAYGFVIFLFVSLLFWIMIRIIKKEHISIKYGSTWFRLIVLAGLSLFLMIVFLVGWINLEKSRKTHLEDVGQNLTGVLSIFQNRLDFWLIERKSFMKQMGFNPKLAAMTKRLLAVPAEKNILLQSKELANIRSFFKESNDIFSNIGFFIINSEYISIGSRRDTNIGTLNLISKQYPDLLKKAFQGEVGFVPPIPSDVHLGTSKGKQKPPTMFFIGPIWDLDGKVIAVFTLRVDPWRDFSKVVTALESLKTGEIYAFEKNGYLLTPSRFDKQLRSIGLLEPSEASALNIEIRNPGVNMLEGKYSGLERSQQPLTHMVQNVLKLKVGMEQNENQKNHSEIESNTTSYRDYRGVPVYGAWLWNNTLQIGLTAEMDVDEALDHYYQTRLMVFSILGFTLFLAVSAVLLVLVLGERASRILIKAKDDLEGEVERRTAELEMNQDQLKTADERSRLLLNSAGEGIFGVDTAGKINFINPSALTLLGYAEAEIIGQEAHPFIHHSHADGSHFDYKDCPMYHSFAHGKSGKFTNEVLWRKDGTCFDVEYSSTPIQKEAHLLGAVVTFLDVTDRKKAAMETAIAKENLDLALKSANMGTWKYYVPENRLEADENTKKLYGLEQVELDGSMDQWFTFVHPDDLAPIGEVMQHTMANKIIDYKTNFRITMPEKQVRHILSVGKFSYTKNGDASTASGLVWDITDIKVMEDALVAEKTHLQKVLDISPVGVAISVGEIMQFANPKILEWFDLKVGDPAPQFYANITDRNHIISTLKNSGIIEDYELQMVGKNKEIKDMLVTYMAISYEGKDAVLGWVMDITNLKKTDRELRQQFDEMSRFRKLAVGREIKMVDIKKEINDLLEQLNQDPKYKIVK